MMYPLDRYNYRDRALMFYYWTIGAASDDEYTRYKREYRIAEALAVRDNERRAMAIMREMGF